MDYTNMYGTDEYRNHVQQNYMFLEDQKYFEEEEITDIAGEFKVITRNYSCTEGIERWSLSRNFFMKEEQVLHSFITVDPHVSVFDKIIYHRNGHRYYPFHVDLYGISYIDVDTLEVYNYVPKGRDAEAEDVCGESFIVADIDYDIDSNLIAYSGCYWAWPYDVMVGDFSNPMDFEPKLISIHAVLRERCKEYAHIDFVEWKNNALRVCVESDDEVFTETIAVSVLKDETIRRAAHENVRYHYEKA